MKYIQKLGNYFKKNFSFALLMVFLVLMIFSPGAKSFVLKGLMLTGLFNAKIEPPKEKPKEKSNPEFTFIDEKGTRQSLSALKGKVVFINFWASWCPPCRAELPSIEKLYAEFKSSPDLYFLLVNEDNDPEAARSFIKKENYGLPLLNRAEGAGSIFCAVLPTTVILDKHGQVRYRHEGLANFDTKGFKRQLQDLINE